MQWINPPKRPMDQDQPPPHPNPTQPNLSTTPQPQPTQPPTPAGAKRPRGPKRPTAGLALLRLAQASKESVLGLGENSAAKSAPAPFHGEPHELAKSSQVLASLGMRQRRGQRGVYLFGQASFCLSVCSLKFGERKFSIRIVLTQVAFPRLPGIKALTCSGTLVSYWGSQGARGGKGAYLRGGVLGGSVIF